jgi:GT2 family glycosyltransferase
MRRADVTVVVATRNRRRELRVTLAKLAALSESPRVIVVDNGSQDGTADEVRGFEGVELVELGANRGAYARTVGAALAQSELVAFSDDDSWWRDGSLRRAAGVFAAHPALGLLAARVLVGPGERLDPVSAMMESAGRESPPGPAVLGFLACGAVVRRDAFLQAGGFRHESVGGEEALLAIDLAAQGWLLAYVRDVVAHHHPSRMRDGHERATTVIYSELRTAWLRRRPKHVVRLTAAVVAQAVHRRHARRALGQFVHDLPFIIRNRRPVDANLERRLSALCARRSQMRAGPARRPIVTL